MTDHNHDNDICDECRFWEPTAEGNKGWCRRKPPVPFLGEKNREAIWPMTLPTDWCGAYRKNRKAPT